MNTHKSSSGIALICGLQGVIQAVLLNEPCIGELAPNQSIEGIAAVGSRVKVLDFIREAQNNGMALYWTINVVCGESVEMIYLSAVRQDDVLMVVGSSERSQQIDLCHEFIQWDIPSGLVLRDALLMRRAEDDEQDQEDGFLYDQISRLNNELVNLQRDLAKKNAELVRLNEQIKNQAARDYLTGLYNRRGFAELAQQQIDQSKRYHRPLSVMLFDIDLFKQINDQYGHLAGDAVLMELAARCARQLRAPDVFSRFGGDEFSILLPETTLSEAVVVANRIRQSVIQPFKIDGTLLNVSISIGIAALIPAYESVESLLRAADQVLYRAKEAGRNRIEAASDVLLG
ncbi:MAG: GGDEF domain-containing protein [Anaerolineaceae bacterium]|nr:GGDEF domain-containing protein [Anaerolineaceae bacterium]